MKQNLLQFLLVQIYIVNVIANVVVYVDAIELQSVVMMNLSVTLTSVYVSVINKLIKITKEVVRLPLLT